MLRIDIIGNLGGDAVTKTLNGKPTTTFSVATTERYNDSKGNRQERVTWFSCMYRGSDKVLPYLKKGTKVFVRGNLRMSLYEYNGQPAISADVSVRELELISNRTDGQDGTQVDMTPATHENELPY